MSYLGSIAKKLQTAKIVPAPVPAPAPAPVPQPVVVQVATVTVPEPEPFLSVSEYVEVVLPSTSLNEETAPVESSADAPADPPESVSAPEPSDADGESQTL